jgi:hypothetical protein
VALARLGLINRLTALLCFGDHTITVMLSGPPRSMASVMSRSDYFIRTAG